MPGRLAGRRIVVTRTREQAAGLVDALHAEGAEAVVVPLITTAVLASPEELQASFAAFSATSAARWAVFSSATAVRLVLGVLEAAGFIRVRVAAVGAATAEALQARGVSVEVVPDEANAAALAAALRAQGLAGAHVWMPAAQGAAARMAERLQGSGAVVEGLDLYQSRMPAGAPQRLEAALAHRVDAITLTSGSTARHLRDALQGRALAAETLLACIGEPAAIEARAGGLPNVAVAAEASVAGLVELLVARLGAAQPLR